MRFIKYLLPFLAIVIPTTHHYTNQPPAVHDDKETKITSTAQNEQIILHRFSDSERFLRFANHSSHSSHSSHESHSSHTSGSHTSHYSGSGSADCNGCAFDVDDIPEDAKSPVHSLYTLKGFISYTR
jgi:hypothetical protein